MKKYLFHIAALSLLLTTSAQNLSAETVPAKQEIGSEKNAHDLKMQWFRDAHFGIFIHWGLYSHYAGIWEGKDARMPNGCAEWMMLVAKAPREKYSAGAKNFNPKNFDAESWVKAIKDSGAKYIVITAKHHEGFAMFKSAASPYNIVDATPFGRDPLKELAAACKKYGIRLGFYYSQNLDWYHPGGAGGDWDPTHKGSPDEFVDKIAIPQIKELLTNYGDISVLWYDIGNGGIINDARAKRIQQAVKSVAPNIITNNRLGAKVPGDIQTPENTIPATGIPGKDWETCMTMNHTWGFCAADTDWKSPETLIRALCDATSKGGNLLLNVGPTGLGEIPQASLERLDEVGKWLKDYGNTIYGTRASIFANLPKWGRWTTRAGTNKSTLYAIVFDAPASKEIIMPGLQNKILKAYELKTLETVKSSTSAGTVKIEIPKNLLKRKNFVIAVEIAGTPTIDKAIHAEASGEYRLLPILAECSGNIRRKEFSMGGLGHSPEERLGYWTGKNDSASWQIKTAKPQKFAVSMRYAAPEKSAGSIISLTCGSAGTLDFEIKSTGGWDKFSTGTLGEIELPAGTHTITLRAKINNGDAPCNAGVITLSPK